MSFAEFSIREESRFDCSAHAWHISNSAPAALTVQNVELVFGVAATQTTHWISDGDKMISNIVPSSGAKIVLVRSGNWSGSSPQVRSTTAPMRGWKREFVD